MITKQFDRLIAFDKSALKKVNFRLGIFFLLVSTHEQNIYFLQGAKIASTDKLHKDSRMQKYCST